MTLSKIYLFFFMTYYSLTLIFGNRFLKSGFNPQALLLMLSLAYIMFNLNFYIKFDKKNKINIIFRFLILYSFFMIILSFLNFVGLFNIINIENNLRWIPRQSYFIIIGLFVGSALYKSLLSLKYNFIFKYRNLIYLLFFMLFIYEIREEHITFIFNIGEEHMTFIFFPTVIYTIYIFDNKYLGTGLFFVYLLSHGFYKITGLLICMMTFLFMLMNYRHILQFKKHIYIIFFFIICSVLIFGMANLDYLKELDSNTMWRLAFWHDNIKILIKTFFTGVGFGTPYYSYNLSSVIQIWNLSTNLEYGFIDTAFIIPQHNSFVNIFYRLGIIGFILFLLFNFYIFKYFKNSLRKFKNDPVVYKSLKVILLGFILSIINIAFNAGLESPRIFLSYLLFTPLSIAYNKIILNKEKYEIAK